MLDELEREITDSERELRRGLPEPWQGTIEASLRLIHEEGPPQ
jgi:hypothetical protein